MGQIAYRISLNRKCVLRLQLILNESILTNMFLKRNESSSTYLCSKHQSVRTNGLEKNPNYFDVLILRFCLTLST